MNNNAVDQVKERLGVAEIIGEYVKLEKSGVNYKACCPFHSENTPSFTVNTERNFWYCFGCQEGGDIFSFVEKIEGLEFKEVLERLAERANVELPRFDSQQAKVERSQKQKVLDALELTSNIYQQLLIRGKKSKELLEYLKERGLTEELVKEFRVGYAPESWRAVLEYLLKNGHQLGDIQKAGLIIAKQNSNEQDSGSYYDRFRDRIAFPVMDVNGKAIGFSARIVPGGDDKAAKYINSPQSIVYDKGRVLYGLYQAKKAIRSSGYVIIVEGQMDVVLSHKVDVKNVIAASGTALTDNQVKLLKRYTDKVKLCFDMDNAGQKATKKSIQICLRNDMQVKIILLPGDFKDVGEIVVGDEAGWKKAVEQAIPVMEYYFKTIFKKYNQEDIQDKKVIIKELLNVIKDISDPIEYSYWIKKLAMRTQTDENLLTDLVEKVKLKSSEEKNILITKEEQEKTSDKETTKPRKTNNTSRHSKLQCRLLGLMVGFPKDVSGKIKALKEDTFFTGKMLKVFKLIKEHKPLGEYESGVNECVAKLMYKDKENDLVEVDVNPLSEWDIIIGELVGLERKSKVKEIELALKQAEANDDEETIAELMSKLKNLLEPVL